MFLIKFTKEDIHTLIACSIGVEHLDSTLIYEDDLIGIKYDREFGSCDLVIKEEYILTPDDLIDLISKELRHHYNADINPANLRFSWEEDESPDGVILKMSRNFQ